MFDYTLSSRSDRAPSVVVSVSAPAGWDPAKLAVTVGKLWSSRTRVVPATEAALLTAAFAPLAPPQVTPAPATGSGGDTIAVSVAPMRGGPGFGSGQSGSVVAALPALAAKQSAAAAAAATAAAAAAAAGDDRLGTTMFLTATGADAAFTVPGVFVTVQNPTVINSDKNTDGVATYDVNKNVKISNNISSGINQRPTLPVTQSSGAAGKAVDAAAFVLAPLAVTYPVPAPTGPAAVSAAAAAARRHRRAAAASGLGAGVNATGSTVGST